MKRYLAIALMIISLTASISYADSETMPLSLRQCIDLALKNNVDMLISHARENQAKGEQMVLDADLLPQIDAVASQERTWWENVGALGFAGFGVIGPYNTFDARVMVSERIMDFSALAHAQAGKIKWKASQLQIELAAQQVILATSTVYIQALGYEQELATSYEDVRLAEHFLSLSQHQLDAGLASSVDVASNQTQLAQEKAKQEELRLNVIKSELELKRLIKLPLSQEIELSDHLNNAQMDLLKEDEAINRASQNRIEMKIANADSDYTLTELKASQREYLPKIDVSGSYGETGINPDRDVSHAADAMVKISLPIWEGNRINGEVKENKALNDEQRFKADDLNWKIEEDVRLSLATLVSTRAQMDAEKKVQDFAQQELNLAQDRYSAGLGDNTQLIHAQVALADSKDKFVQTQALYDQAQLNYFAALGAPRNFNLSTIKDE